MTDIEKLINECIIHARREFKDGAWAYEESEIVSDVINYLASTKRLVIPTQDRAEFNPAWQAGYKAALSDIGKRRRPMPQEVIEQVAAALEGAIKQNNSCPAPFRVVMPLLETSLSALSPYRKKEQ